MPSAETPAYGLVPDWVFVAIGGALGALGRGLVDFFAGATIWDAGFGIMWSTLIVDVVGALILGIAHAVLAHLRPTPANARRRLFLTTGFAGAFTTYGTLITSTVNGSFSEFSWGRVIPLTLIGSLGLLILGVLVAGIVKKATGAVLVAHANVRGRGVEGAEGLR